MGWQLSFWLSRGGFSVDSGLAISNEFVMAAYWNTLGTCAMRIEVHFVTVACLM